MGEIPRIPRRPQSQPIRSHPPPPPAPSILPIKLYPENQPGEVDVPGRNLQVASEGRGSRLTLEQGPLLDPDSQTLKTC